MTRPNNAAPAPSLGLTFPEITDLASVAQLLHVMSTKWATLPRFEEVARKCARAAVVVSEAARRPHEGVDR